MKENFLVLSFIENNIKATALKVDFQGKEIKVISKKTEKDDDQNLKKILHRAFPFNQYKLILLFESKNAFTCWGKIKQVNEKPKLIDEVQLQNIVSKSAWAFFDHALKEASKSLLLSSDALLLADIRIYEIFVDSKKILNLLGYKGRNIEINFSGTFVQREYFKKITTYLPQKAKIVLTSEGLSSAHSLLQRLSKDKNFILAEVLKDRTDFYKKSVLDSLSFGKNHLLKSLSQSLGVGISTAASILQKFCAGEISASAALRLKRDIKDSLRPLIYGLELVVSRLKIKRIYIDSLSLPDVSIFPKMIKCVDTGAAAEYFGFVVNNQLDFWELAGILEYYFLPPEDLINRLIKKRMKWLMVTNDL